MSTEIAAVHLAVKGVECSIGLLHDSANNDDQRGIARTVQDAGRRQPQAEGRGVATRDRQRNHTAHDDGRAR